MDDKSKQLWNAVQGGKIPFSKLNDQGKRTYLQYGYDNNFIPEEKLTEKARQYVTLRPKQQAVPNVTPTIKQPQLMPGVLTNKGTPVNFDPNHTVAKTIGREALRVGSALNGIIQAPATLGIQGKKGAEKGGLKGALQGYKQGIVDTFKNDGEKAATNTQFAEELAPETMAKLKQAHPNAYKVGSEVLNFISPDDLLGLGAVTDAAKVAKLKLLPESTQALEKLSAKEMSNAAKPAVNAGEEIADTKPVEIKEYRGKLPPVEIDIIAEKAKSWKDKAQKLAYKRETMERNLYDIIPDKNEAKQIVDTYIEPIKKSEATSIREITKMRGEVKGLEIKPFSKESELVQKYGEGLISKEDLAKETKNPEKIIKAAEYFRSKYDELLNKANEVLQFNGYKPIAKRPNYFPHQGEIETLMQKIGVESQELPTDINGMTDIFVPGKNFFANALQRKGDKTAFDAVRGFDKYIEGINKVIHQTGNIQRIRQLEKTLRKSFEGTEHLTNFVSELREYGNLLAGKQSKLDRGAEEFVGRQAYKTADTIRKQLGANMVGGNVSSALTNFIPLTQSLASTDKGAFVQAMADTIANVFKNDGFIDKSDYLIRRFGSDRLALTNWQKTGQAANWMFKVVDGFTSQVITRSKYLEGIKKGLPDAEALKQANNYAAKVMADRSIGQTPTLFASKTLAPLNMFQIEVNNQISHLFKDLPREYEGKKLALASAYAQVALYSYLFNNLYEKSTGRRPAFDVIGVAQKAVEDYNNDNLDNGKATKNLINNVANQLPFASAITGGRIPLASAIPDVLGIATGEADAKKELLKPVFNLLPPTGGAQINKTIQGIKTFKKGGSYNTGKNQLKYPIEKTTPNAIRGALFGQYAFPEAQNYYKNDESQLSEKQTEKYENAIKKGASNVETYDKIMKERKLNSLKLEISKIRNNKELSKEKKTEEIQKIRSKISKLNKK